jgi:hypothetical protein
MDLASNNNLTGTIPTTFIGPQHTFSEDDADVHMTHGLNDWVHLTKSDFKHSIGRIYHVSVTAFAYIGGAITFIPLCVISASKIAMLFR